ncbi:hypothetical protein [Flavobacterium johnsoniae]|uniref:Hypothetical lipoprotein n=1 Tax=Flavobacterium johnsoniae (strain ATCC 17061 / DSM 2064 / JCM 8514 / BCRC 14874 / CCUG 350202 / NBRC 14942 / NCIMB 11054 / UW101) TaxID=376686 RepID=A5FE60_FLAJ1|nr:hypothetical protein [Flavobacterium johnsoniae]ABQ06516.1 hypothetical lipoprotein [Flavobacterium johnsoniae UW101]OXE99755.1 hypothetical protein B0A63_10645 [Flavobacterium johnsoniae UW101]WQG82268.1 hypothetical protein SR927_03945 [Flavobacterium johnsoniae UW101]SHK78080.1 hypothetical protein SAMN05444146_2252 [Flavobacterium johnsoniae]
MKRLIKFSFILLLITTLGCTSESNNCTTPPPYFSFEFVDKDSGENLYTNGTFDAKQAVTVTDLDTDKVIQYTYMKNEDLNRLVINSIGWQSGVFNYSIAFQGKSVFELHASAERVSEKGCSFSRINSFEIKNAEFQLDKTTGIYKILINTKI